MNALGEQLLSHLSSLLGGPQVKAVLDAGAPVNYCRPGERTTPLFIAAENGDLVSMRTLIEAGADVRTAGEHSIPVLVLLAKDGYTGLVRQLLFHHDGQLDVDEPDSQGYSAMLLAVAKGRESVLRLLIACGADVNRPREPTFCAPHAKRDWPLLNCALKIGWQSETALLLAAGADPNSVCAGGKTALQDARSHADDSLAALLIAAGAESTTTPQQLTVARQKLDDARRQIARERPRSASACRSSSCPRT